MTGDWRARYWGSACLALSMALFTIGCSSSAPGGGSVVGGAGNTSTNAGAGGVSFQLGGGDTGGAAAGGGSAGHGGAGGSAGSAGATGTAPDAFSAALDKPSYDCRTDAETKDCVSVAGMVAGHGFNEYCADINSPLALLLSPPRWPTACAAIQQKYQVDVVVQAPGQFHATRTLADSAPGFDVRVEINGASGNSQASNFVSAEIAGNVTTDPASGDAIVVGTFHATWSAPDANCTTQGGLPCEAADLNGTFRSDNYLKP